MELRQMMRGFSATNPLSQLMARFVDRPASSNPSGHADSWLRASPRDSDRVLLDATHLWLRQIPSSLLPKHLCRLHPHLAHRFATCWGHRDEIEALVDELLCDQRGGRRGFAPHVRREIEQLDRFHARWLEDPLSAWRAVVRGLPRELAIVPSPWAQWMPP